MTGRKYFFGSSDSPLTWRCHICKKTREDKYISVAVHDRSREWELPVGHIISNVRYCNDNKDCETKAKDPTYAHHGQSKECKNQE